MSLTNSDLQAIDKLIVNRIQPLEKGVLNLEKGQAKLEKGIYNLEKRQSRLEIGLNSVKNNLKEIDKKFDKLFNFLDRDWSKLARRISYHDDLHGVDTKNL